MEKKHKRKDKGSWNFAEMEDGHLPQERSKGITFWLCFDYLLYWGRGGSEEKFPECKFSNLLHINVASFHQEIISMEYLDTSRKMVRSILHFKEEHNILILAI